MVLVVEQFVSQLAGVIGRKLDVHRQPQFDGAWADGHQRANVAVGVIELAFLDIAGRIGGKDEIGLAEFLRQQLCQVDSTVQALAIQLAEAAGRFFRVTQEHQGLGAVSRLRTAFAGLKGKEQGTCHQQGRKEHQGAALQAMGELEFVDH
ncbi:hypothetical protein D3C71_1591370 [compost metagenome]